MKVPKLFLQSILIIVFVLTLSLIISLIYNYYDSFYFYKNLKTILLLILISGILIGNSLKTNFKSKLIDIISSPIYTFGIIFLTICLLALFINKLILTGFKDGEIIYHQISTIFIGLISLGLFVYLHVNNLKNKNNVA